MTRYFKTPEYTETVIKWIAEFIRSHGYPPTGQEMSDAGFGSTKVEAKYILDYLAEIGEIERNRGARAFRLTNYKYTLVKK